MPTPLALNTRAKVLLGVGLIVLAGLSIHRLWFAGPPGPYVALAGETMGTTWEVKLASRDVEPDEIREAAALIQATLDEVVAAMSNWEPASDVSRFNANRSTEPVTISAQTAEVLAAAERASLATRNGFDVTVGPLVTAWGFGTAARVDHTPPTDEALAAIKAHVGHGLLVLDPAVPSLAKRDPRVEIDLSAIAKGYGVDRVARALEAAGHHDFLVEVGGGLRAAGVRLDGKPWRVAIERPSEELRAIHATLILRDSAMATSGDYRNFYELDGRRVSHTIDPRNGRPITHGLASVSVVDPSAMWADALATGLNVLGPAAGYHVAETQGIAAYFIVRREEGGFESRPTTAMQALLEPAERLGGGAGSGTVAAELDD